MARVLILGGGLTGLSTAYFLQKQATEDGIDLDYTVLEASPRWGGKIASEEAGGFLVEGGPDSFITRKPWALELVRELGLGDQICETPPDAGRVFLLRDGVPVELPEGMIFMVPTAKEPFLRSNLLSEEGKRRALAEVDVPARDSSEEESLADFVTRRFGPETLDRLGQPLMAGIHAADPERLSLTAAFPEMAQMERRFGSLIRGLEEAHRKAGIGKTSNSSRVSLRGGIGQLVETLVARLNPRNLHLGCEARSLRRAKQGFTVEDQTGRPWTADAVVITLPSYVAAELTASLRPSLASALNEIPYTSTATLSLGFPSGDVEHPLDGLGVIFPKIEGRSLQACTWSSSKFQGRAPHGHVLLRAFIGGAGAEHLVDRDEASLVSLALEELGPLLGLRAAPILTRLFRWPRSLPQMELGHRGRVAAISGGCGDGLFVAGAAYQGIGLPDAVHSAQKSAANLLAELR